MTIEHHHGLEDVGRRVAAEQDRMLGETTLPDTHLLLAGVRSRSRRAQKHRRAAGMATAAVVFSAVLFALRMRPSASEPSAAAVSSQPAEGVRQAETSNLPLEFTDGTRVLVKQGATADVRNVREHGATIALVTGTLQLNVVHAADTRWDVVAGDFDVRVTGTRFDATWDPQEKQLTVAMAEGSVRVSGPCVDETLSAPSTKVFRCNEPERSPTPPSGEGSPAASVGMAAAAPPASAQRTEAQARQPSHEVSAAKPPREASAAESAQALLDSGDTARLSGDTSRAREIYKSIRDRFPGTDAAAKSAFLLGRLAEQDGSADDAVRFYQLSIGDGARGAFSQDALGRTMEMEQRRGNAERARALATEYLQKHPSGPYSAYASSILDVHR